MANPSRYRYIQFYGGRILQSREVAEMQRIQEGLDSGGVNRVALDLDIIYREGATFNILPSISLGSITLAPINSSLPMYIFVRGRWELLQPSEVASINFTTGGNVYLNWVLRQVTSSEDTSLVDTNTGEPTADMGELDLAISSTDTSGVALASNQFEKNTHPIVVFNYNTSNVLVPIDNVNNIAKGNANTSGLVSLSTNTSSGEAAASDDPRLSDSRNPTVGSVVDASVRTPVAIGGNNTDGTPIYNLTGDPGGISSEKIIHVTGTQRVGDLLEWLKGQFSSLYSALTNHIGQRLGLSNTHPMPSAADVGATPLSHVGQPLGLPTSHPAEVNTSSGGFQLNRDASVTPAANDPAFGVFNSGTLISALLHNGDIMSAASAAFTATPQPSSILSNPASGPLGLMSTIAKVLSQHVNQTVDANPHGLTAGDLNAATVPYVDNAVTNVLNQSENYTNSVVPTLTLSSSVVTLNSYFTESGTYSGTGGSTQNVGTYLILRFAPNGASGVGAIEIAIGSGTANGGTDVDSNGDIIPLPNNNFSYSNFIGNVSVGLGGQLSHTINQTRCYFQNGLASQRIIAFVNDNNSNRYTCNVNWIAVAWRTNA